MSFARPTGPTGGKDAKGDPRLAAPEDSWPTTRVCELRPPSGPSTIVLVISGPIVRTDVPGLCGRVRAALNRTHGELVVCDVSALADPDAVTVDALARLQLTARRLGRHVRLRHACGELRDLIALMGLQGVVRPYAALPRESPWQTEEREPTPGVEEEGDPGDPIA